MKSFAILIDAGFARHKLYKILKRKPQAEDFKNLAEQIAQSPYFSQASLYRIFYYDAYPTSGKMRNPISEEEIDLGKSDTANENNQLLRELKEVPFFALRMGITSTNGNSWKLKARAFKKLKKGEPITPDDITPNITQKGVDTKIGLDLATLSIKKQVQSVVLVTGDSDFVPAIKLARTEGVQIFLTCMGHTIKEDLKEHVDVILADDLILNALKKTEL